MLAKADLDAHTLNNSLRNTGITSSRQIYFYIDNHSENRWGGILERLVDGSVFIQLSNIRPWSCRE